MVRHALTNALAWAAVFAGTWFAWAWLPYGALPVLVLAVALWLHAWRVSRRVAARPGLPRPLDGHHACAYLTGALVVALLVGYGPDWLVQTALGMALLLKCAALWRGRAAGSRVPSP